MNHPLFARSKRLILLICIALLASACSEGAFEPKVQEGEPTPDLSELGSAARGKAHILNYGCGACHTISGIPGADTTVGPPLTDLADRRYIAGALINTPENLVTWIQAPHSVQPTTAMPDLNVSAADAADIAAYLLTQP